MNYLTVDRISKSYGEKILFEDITLHIEKGNKVAFVAKNGTGKSTLIRIVVGQEASEGEHGRVLISKEARLQYLEQSPTFQGSQSVLEVVFDSDNPMIQALKDYESALLEPENGERLQAALLKMDDLKAWDFEVTVKQILSKLNINDLNQPINLLSGGQQKRVALAKILMAEPDFLILDEPTNHLDLDMIEWLENYLAQSNLTIFMVTHDRYFLERVCSHIIELDGGTIYKYKGNYSYYLERKAMREEVEMNRIERAKRMMRDELKWVQRMPKARGTKAKARMDAFQGLKEIATKKIDTNDMKFSIKQQRLGKRIMEFHHVYKAFGDLKILEDFDYKFRKGERVGIVGRNGAGKSTFLEILTGRLQPDKGRIRLGETVQVGYYTQDGIKLKEDKRMIEVIKDIAPFIEMNSGQKLYAAEFLELFLFPKHQHRVYVSRLSGGERRRLYLLTVLMQNPNFLILDEPTNDLDILTLNVLEEFLMEFQGCLVIVSHDRFFMDKLVEHIFVFEGDGKVKDYNGNYSDYKATKRLEAQNEKREEKERQKNKVEVKVEEAPTQRKLSYKERREIEQLEKDIEKMEERKEEITVLFGDTSLSGSDIEQLTIELSELEKTIEEKENRWLELSEYA